MSKVQLDAILKLVDVQINPQVFRKISQSVAGLPAALVQTQTNMKGVAAATATANKRLAQTGNQLSNNERAARLFLQRMAQFAILLPTFATLNRAIQGSVSFLFEFDSALRDIVRVDVGNLSGRMEEIGDAAIKTAIDFGVLAQEVLSTTKVFVQAGLTIEDAQERARLAIAATQVSTLSSANAVEFFIAAANQFKLSNEGLVASLDALVKVEDLAAVEAQDVAEAFRTGGNSFAQFGKDINDAIGLISALREQTRKSGREIGTFFKTLQTRIFAAGESRDALEALGVQVENLDGSLRPTLDVLNDMKMAFDRLTEAQAANAGKAIGGVRQFESLIATLNSLERANELSQKASEAAGAVDEKRTVTDAKLERQLGKLIAQGQALAEALGDSGLEDSLAGALKAATGLLQVFTSLADFASDIGANIAPLLALGGVVLGKSVFGLSGGQGGGAGGAANGPQPGLNQNFIGPLTQSQRAITDFSKNLGNTFRSLGGVTKEFTKELLTTSQISKANGIQLRASGQAFQVHTQALKQNLVALKASSAASLNGGVMSRTLKGGGGTLLATLLGTTVLPKAFDALEQKVTDTGGKFGQLGGDLVNITGNTLSFSAALATLGPIGIAVGAAFGFLSSAIPKAVDAINEEIAAKKDLAALNKKQNESNRAVSLLISESSEARKLQASLLESLKGGVAGKKSGTELLGGIESGFSTFTKTTEAQKAFLTTNESVRESLLKNIQTFGIFVKLNEDYLKAAADSNDQLDAFNELQNLIASDSDANLGPAFNRLLVVIGATVPEIDELTGVLKEAQKDFETLQKVLEVNAFADSIRTLGMELELAQMGPEALSDSVVKMQAGLAVAERESGNTLSRLQQELAGLFERLDEFAVGLNPEGLSAAEFFNKVKNGVETLDPKKIAEFEDFINRLPPAQRKAADEILTILDKQLKQEVDIQNKRNELQAEVNRRQKELLETEAQAAQNAFESTRRFSAELQQFGDVVSTDVLSAFQNISLGDVDKVLAGTSDLDSSLQNLIRNAFADPVVKAETDLRAATESTQAELDILSSRLINVNDKIADQANASQLASLNAEKHAIELEMEQVAQKAAVESTKLKIKVIEEEREAEEKAAEAARKRAELLEKLADASRAFDKELRDVERSFSDFQEKKIADLLGQEADARNELKEAQQEVLSSTGELADAYDNLIKAQLEFNGVIAEAKVKSSLLARDIGMLTGQITTFDQGLATLSNAFNDVLDESNMTLQKRIDLERQLAEETLNFLQQAKDEIVGAGLGIFGQTASENQGLGQGIQGLQFIAEQLGGSFESFLGLSQNEIADLSGTLLNLPAEFRQQILDALNFLPSSTNIGGFSVDQLKQAIGQVGAGVAPEVGLPSIEELTGQQVEQLNKLQQLALQDAQLQFAQVKSAQDQVVAAQETAEAAQILQERASENLEAVRDAVLEEKAVLDLANDERRDLLMAVVSADDRNSLMQIEKEAQLFAEQNSTFREVGDIIVQGISSAIGARLTVLEAASAVGGAAKGYIPNFAKGNLSPKEAAGLLRAASREKKAMPTGAGLAVANTSEAIIPMRNAGYIPNFAEGSEISAGISAIKGINETVVAAIARSVTAALSDLNTGGGNTEDLLTEIITQLGGLGDLLDDINAVNATIATNTASDTTTGAGTTNTSSTQRVEITLQTNQNNSVSITGLENLRSELEEAITNVTAEQVDAQVTALFDQLDSVLTALQERGLLSSFGQSR